VYRLHGKEDHFRSVLYKNTGHEYLPEMRHSAVARKSVSVAPRVMIFASGVFVTDGRLRLSNPLHDVHEHPRHEVFEFHRSP
jgi:N-acetyl-gamma-glutamylphosphate reductase